ncbi:hypothetical protein BD410DRAFT_792200 [Rickenella mellea]|uniref:Uncharacterized protein n=1 Tax=Rickenella mellea TaxID=50990 RepID=A0A4Y7PXQ3_9AGAM|nr:hypothetical protein BD410DRAFT_792200 [Rickenella mellea]
MTSSSALPTAFIARAVEGTRLACQFPWNWFKFSFNFKINGLVSKLRIKPDRQDLQHSPMKLAHQSIGFFVGETVLQCP